MHLSRDARLAQPLGQPVDVRLIAKREPPDVLGEGVFRIDLHKLSPDPNGFLGLAQVAERDGEKVRKAREKSVFGLSCRRSRKTAAAAA